MEGIKAFHAPQKGRRRMTSEGPLPSYSAFIYILGLLHGMCMDVLKSKENNPKKEKRNNLEMKKERKKERKKEQTRTRSEHRQHV